MGELIDGKWQETNSQSTDAKGAFLRASSAFRSWVTKDGQAGPSGEGGFEAEPGRYHLFIASSCPWAHRTAIYRELKGLDNAVSMSLASARNANGWCFSEAPDDMVREYGDGFALHQVYTAAVPSYSGKVTVPTLWDRKQQTVVSNESSEIIRMLNSAFDRHGAKAGDYYPEKLRDQIEEANAIVYERVNNGVYRTGFAKTQSAYEEAVADVFHGLDWMEERLAEHRYLAGDRVTEADWRAFPTLLRFDPVYYGHFKCNIRRLRDYPNLTDYTRELYQWPGIADTCHLPSIKSGYYQSMLHINPTGIVPVGPDMSWLREPHDRKRLQASTS